MSLESNANLLTAANQHIMDAPIGPAREAWGGDYGVQGAADLLAQATRSIDALLTAITADHRLGEVRNKVDEGQAVFLQATSDANSMTVNECQEGIEELAKLAGRETDRAEQLRNRLKTALGLLAVTQQNLDEYDTNRRRLYEPSASC